MGEGKDGMVGPKQFLFPSTPPPSRHHVSAAEDVIYCKIMCKQLYGSIYVLAHAICLRTQFLRSTWGKRTPDSTKIHDS